jgi:hypothetical protein
MLPPRSAAGGAGDLAARSEADPAAFVGSSRPDCPRLADPGSEANTARICYNSIW